jgi:putative flippase GtrA
VLVTENGIGTDDDDQRVRYVQRALEGVLACIVDGIEVLGYTYWSAFDNFEWAFGYAPRFGLVAVDRETTADAEALGGLARGDRPGQRARHGVISRAQPSPLLSDRMPMTRQPVERARGLGRKFLKYSAVSVISVVVTQAVLVACVGMLGWSAAWSNITAVCVGSVPAYLLNRAWTWGKSGKSHLVKEVLPFWGMALAGLGLSTWLVVLAERYWPASTLAVSLANLLAFGILWFGKFAVLEEILFKHEHGRHAGAPAGIERRCRAVRCWRSARTAGSRRSTSAPRRGSAGPCCSPSTTTAGRRRTRPAGSTTTPGWWIPTSGCWTPCRSSVARSTTPGSRTR